MAEVSTGLKSHFNEVREVLSFKLHQQFPCLGIAEETHAFMFMIEIDGWNSLFTCKCGRTYHSTGGRIPTNIIKPIPHLKEIFSGKYPDYFLWPLWEKIKTEVKTNWPSKKWNGLEEVLHYLKLMKAMKKRALRGGTAESKEPARLPMQNSLPNNLNLNNLALSVIVLLFALAASMFLSWRSALTLDVILNSIKSLKDDELSLEVIFSTIEAVRRENLRLDP